MTKRLGVFEASFRARLREAMKSQRRMIVITEFLPPLALATAAGLLFNIFVQASE